MRFRAYLKRAGASDVCTGVNEVLLDALRNKGFIILVVGSDWKTVLCCQPPLGMISAKESCLSKAMSLSWGSQHPRTDRV